MNLVSQYVLRVGAYLIFSIILEGILPQGGSKKMIKMMISLVFAYVLIQPVVSWLQQELPLEYLTTAEIQWGETESIDGFEKQAQAMMSRGYESVLIKQGLPGELQDQYQILSVEIGDNVEVLLARQNEIGGLTDYSLELGQIGRSGAEDEAILESLSTHWGIPKENLEMKIR